MPLPGQGQGWEMRLFPERLWTLNDASSRARRWKIRRQRAADIERVTAEILCSFDQEAFNDRFRKYWDFFELGASRKFVNIRRWLPEAVSRFFVHGLDRLPEGSSVCDLGCGTGYFLLVCRHLGYHGVGLDLDDDPLYTEMIDFFELQRVIHRIEPGVSLPQLPEEPFGVVTAFMTCFNRDSEGRPWHGQQWSEFLTDVRQHMTDHGVVIIKFNRNHRTDELCPKDVPKAVKRLRAYTSRFYGDILQLTCR